MPSTGTLDRQGLQTCLFSRVCAWGLIDSRPAAATSAAAAAPLAEPTSGRTRMVSYSGHSHQPVRRISQSVLRRAPACSEAAIDHYRTDHQARRQPYPKQFTADRTAAAGIGQTKSDVRNPDQSPVAVASPERPEEWNVLTAGGQRIEEPVGGNYNEEQADERPPAHPKPAERSR